MCRHPSGCSVDAMLHKSMPDSMADGVPSLKQQAGRLLLILRSLSACIISIKTIAALAKLNAPGRFGHLQCSKMMRDAVLRM